ncbi:hypothetical protein BDP81DRAFT_35700 [Colletotrichum phormii]|uniref:Uncharacterized protein n=1 Tax=Colletotrichum phormii TaxID=359342 RepID=A0AAI9ZQJ5_9PEZI|nr:uncharacterized protein BDP81DRAFT_35700 [Colletotrichum phormii]KAK1636253.1 hypothetical protein BDP81DRAFT_35700 [Colletotrichum phormii]
MQVLAVMYLGSQRPKSPRRPCPCLGVLLLFRREHSGEQPHSYRGYSRSPMRTSPLCPRQGDRAIVGESFGLASCNDGLSTRGACFSGNQTSGMSANQVQSRWISSASRLFIQPRLHRKLVRPLHTDVDIAITGSGCRITERIDLNEHSQQD